MPKTETMTIRVSAEVRTQLELLAQSMHRSKSYLAAQAIGRFVQSEAEIVDGIKQGLADIQAGRVVSHVDAIARIRETIANPCQLPNKKSA